MMIQLRTIDWICLLTSSSLVAAACYVLLTYFTKAIFSPNLLFTVWNTEQARWYRLRETSAIFRALDRWIVGLAWYLLMKMVWVLPPSLTPSELAAARDTSSISALHRGVSWLLGGAPRIEETSRILTCEQPWHPVELVAACLYIGCGAGAFSFTCTANSLPLAWTAVCAITVAYGAYRFALRFFIIRADKRRKMIYAMLPHAMDAITMVLRSGESLTQALSEFIDEFPIHPLSQEFRRLCSDLKGGLTARAALDGLAARVALVEMDEAVRVLQQMQDHGSYVAENFGRLSNYLRSNQLRKLEQSIGRIETAMALPTMLIMLSCMLCILAPFILSVVVSSLSGWNL